VFINYNNFSVRVYACIFCFRIPPILSEKETTSHRSVIKPLGSDASVQPTRLTSSARPHPPVAVVSHSSRVQSSPTIRKYRRRDVFDCTRQDPVCCHDGARGQGSETEKPRKNDVTNVLPSDVKLSSEVIVSKVAICLSVCLSGRHIRCDLNI